MNVTSYVTEALPFLAGIGTILILVGVGIAPNTRVKGATIFALGIILTIVGGLSAKTLSLPFDRSLLAAVVSFTVGAAAGAWAIISHVRNFSDSAIPMSLIAAASFFAFGWAMAGS